MTRFCLTRLFLLMSRRSKRKGRDLETLVAALEKAASGDPSLKMQSPYMTVDRTNGSQREHDVGIFLTQNHREIVIALECRDRSRNVTMPEVEAFARKCSDTGVDKGGIVSSKGFAADALTKAKHLSIACHTLEQAQDLSWLQTTTLDTYSKRITSLHWLLIPVTDPPKKPTNYHVEDPNGKRMTSNQMTDALLAELNRSEHTFWHRVGVHQFRYRFLMEGFTLCDDDTGERFPLRHANVAAEVEISVTATPIKKWTYRDEIGGTNVIEAGIVPVSEAGVVGDVMFVSGPDGITVSFRPGT